MRLLDSLSSLDFLDRLDGGPERLCGSLEQLEVIDLGIGAGSVVLQTVGSTCWLAQERIQGQTQRDLGLGDNLR